MQGSGISQITVQQPIQILNIKGKKIGFVCSCFSQGLDALRTEPRIQLLFVDPEAGSNAHERRTEKASDHDSDQNLGCEFWQCG
jgi:hypothetical protein